MLAPQQPVAVRFCMAAAQHAVPNPAARICAWLVGVASTLKQDRIEVSYRQIQLGFERDGVTFCGTGCHNATIRTCMQWLEENGFIEVGQGEYTGGGHHAVAVRPMP